MRTALLAVGIWIFMAIPYYQQMMSIEILKNKHKEELLTYQELKLTVTAYTASANECDSTPNTTAINERPVSNKTVAISRNQQQLLGKNIYIEGLGVFRVNDLMHPRYKNHLDIVVASKTEAHKWGKQVKKVVVL